MSSPARCPQCGDTVGDDAPAGLCPNCLLGPGLAEELEPEETRDSGALAGDVPDPQQISEFFPQLIIEQLIGHGGMGAVYLATQKSLDRTVALKIIRPNTAGEHSFAERFGREAKALAKLNHPNIVGIYDFGKVDGMYFFVMEYVRGTDLRRLIHDRQLDADQALKIVPQICDALQFAHDQGVVHRDIKPENILIDDKGCVKIADFGLAKLLGKDDADSHLTGTHQVMGTPRYMAPEQMEGARTVDHRADIYSLGVVFYELLTGELPIGQFEVPSQKVQVDVRLDQVVLRTLAKEPERRYQHASTVKTDVEQISKSAVKDARPLSKAGSRVAEQSPLGPPSSRSKFSLSSVHLAIGFCFVGAALSCLPWVDASFARTDFETYSIENVNLQPTYVFSDWIGPWIPAIFVTLGILLLAFGRSQPVPFWQPLTLAAGGVTILFFTVVYGLTLDEQIHLDSDKLDLIATDGSPVTWDVWGEVEAQVRYQLLTGFYATLGSVFGVLLISAYQLRRWSYERLTVGSMEAVKPTGRRILAQTWDQWWVERDRNVTLAIRVGLALMFLVSLFCFFVPLPMRFQDLADGGYYFRVQFGWPSSWLVHETNPPSIDGSGDRIVGWSSQANYLSLPVLIACVGFLAYYVGWRIDRTVTGRRPHFLFSPWLVLVLWVVAAWLIVPNTAGSLSFVPRVLAPGRDAGPDSLLQAAASGSVSRVRDLLASGADINDKDANGRTALMVAAEHGHVSVFQALLLLGANINETDLQGRTPLMYAVDGDQVAICKAYGELRSQIGWVNIDFRESKGKLQDLIRQRLSGIDPRVLDAVGNQLPRLEADANHQDNLGRTALMQSAARGNVDMANAIRALSYSLKTLQTQDRFGCTASMHAIINGHTEFVRQMIDSGAQSRSRVSGALHQEMFCPEVLCIQNQAGKTALQISVDAGADEIEQLIRAELELEIAARTRIIDAEQESFAGEKRMNYRRRGLAYQALGDGEKAADDLAKAN